MALVVVLDRAARVVMSKGLGAPYRPLNVKFCIKPPTRPERLEARCIEGVIIHLRTPH